MLYLFFDTAVNGYYALSLLKEAFPNYLPLMAEEEKIDDAVAPFIFEIELKKFLSVSKEQHLVFNETVLIESTALLPEVQSHFMQFTIQKIKGRQFYFRFWSNKIFRKYIVTCNLQQLQSFFGPVQQIICEEENWSLAQLYALEAGKLVMRKVAIDVIVFKSSGSLNSSIGNSSNNYNSSNSALTVELNAQRPARKFFD